MLLPPVSADYSGAATAFVEGPLDGAVCLSTNGWVGYLPNPRTYEESGYEVEAGVGSRVAPGSAERVEAVGKGKVGVEEAVGKEKVGVVVGKEKGLLKSH